MVKRQAGNVIAKEADFQRRYEANFAWKSAVSAFQAWPGLRGLWPMSSIAGGPAIPPGGNCNDLSGNGLTLTYAGNPTYNRIGLVPYIDFDGTGDYLTRADTGANDPLDLLGNETYIDAAIQGVTVGCWCEFDGFANSDGLITKGAFVAAPTQVNYALAQFTVPDRVRFYVGTGGGAIVVNSGTLITGQWYFIVGRFKTSTGNIDIFVNGTFSAPVATGLGALINNANPFNLGSVNNNAAGNDLDGRESFAIACAAWVPDVIVQSGFEQTKAMYGVK